MRGICRANRRWLIACFIIGFGLVLTLKTNWLNAGHLTGALAVNAADSSFPAPVQDLVRGQETREMQVLVELSEAPTKQVYDRALRESKLDAAAAQKAATAAAQAQQRKVEAEQEQLLATLKQSPFNAVEIYRVQRSQNAVAVKLAAGQLPELRKLAGVKAVHVLALESLTTPAAPANASGDGNVREAQAAQTSDEIKLPVQGGGASDGSDLIQVLVELNDTPAAIVYGETLRRGAGTQAQTRAAAVAAARSQMTKIRGAQQGVGAALQTSRFAAKEIYRVQRSFNGIAVRVGADRLEAIRRLPGVKAIHPLVLEFPDNSSSVPFLGVPQVWANSLGTGSFTGAGIKIGIIDTGIDYQHANFGGTGALADYQANDRTVAPDAFYPSAKVVGGFDFAGDLYTGANAPVPDADPMDCNGHGSHVAGSAAGFGVTAAGTTFAGPFNLATPFSVLRIGPGTAPQAQLYALRVFGCGGGTNLTIQAIDWAIDPNNDNDFSDHLDVINMSLGSAFGAANSVSALASEAAAQAGVFVVASAGNSGDTFFISGSPGSAQRAIAVASSVDSGQPGAGVTVNAPAGIVGSYVAGTAAFGPAPPPGGVTGNVVVGLDPSDGAGVLTTDGCSPLTNAAAIAGNIALIDRGTCGFTVKVKNAQDAGAIGVLIANSAAGAFGNMGGADPTIIIPSVMVTFADGNTFKANIPGLNVTLFSGADTLSAFSSRGTRQGRPGILKPDIAAPGQTITSSQTGVTCTGTAPSTGCQVPNASGFIADSQPLTISGTSMAAPHVAGIMALLRQQHPDWTIEELKALAMNTALNDVTTLPGGGGSRFGVSRIGAGRVDPPKAALSDVVVFNAEDPGVVSLAFEGQVIGTQTSQKTLRLVNKGQTSVTYDLSLDTSVDAPGVSFSLPGGSSITVPAGGSVLLAVQMNANAAQLDHTKEASIASTQSVTAPASLANLAIPRHFVTEEGGYVNFSQGGTPKLRVPFYVAPRPAAMMSAPATIATGGAPTGSTTIPLTGTDVCTGTLGAGPTCTGTFPTDVASLVTPFELQVVSPRDTSLPAAADIQYAGVAADAANGRLMFGVASYGDWSTPTEVSYTIYIDNNNDGTYDRQIFNTNAGSLAGRFFGVAGQGGQDNFITSVFTPPNSFSNTVAAGTPAFVNRLSASAVDSALFNNNVMFLTATPAQLGLANLNAPFRYKIETCPGSTMLCQQFSGFHLDEANGPYSWSGGAQGLNFGGANLALDLNGASLPVTWNTANLTANGSLGALLLHHQNAAGKRAEVVLLEGTQQADLAIAKSVNNPNPSLGQNVTFTLQVTNNGPDTASNIVVTDLLPGGLTYVSDTGGGAYDSVTGQWTIPGSLAASASVSLQITATVATTDRVDNTASITSSSPLDPLPDNNQSTVSLMAPRSSDLELAMNVSSPTVSGGGAVTFTLTVKNNGPDPAYSVNITESFAAFPALNPGSFMASQGAYNPATGLWTLASLGSGASATLTLNFTAPNTPGALTNSASVSSGVSDPNNANNMASATTVICPTFTIGTPTASGLIGSSYSSSVAASPAAPTGFSYQYSLANSTTLPPGLTLDAGTGDITGTLDFAGTYNFDIKVEMLDAGNVPTGCSATQTRTITVTCPAIPLMPAPNPLGTPGVLYFSSVSLGFSSGVSYRYSLANGTTLPPGLSLNLNTGWISGTPTTTGTFTFDAKVEIFRYNPATFNFVSTGCSDTRTFTIQIVNCVNNPVVTNLNDSGPGSLRAAVATACAGSTVSFQSGLSGTLTLTSGDLLIGQSLTIQGPGAQTLAISGNNTSRLFTTLRESGVLNDITIAGLSLINGNGNGALGGEQGGAIYHANEGTLTLRDASISGCTAAIGGAILFQAGGEPTHTLNLIRSTLSGNTASFSGGGIDIRSYGVVNVINSTIAHNQAQANSGGGIGNSINVRVTVNLVHSTVAGNQGGGIQDLSNLALIPRNSLLAGNAGPDFLSGGSAAGGLYSQGYNLIGNIGGGGFSLLQPTDQVGVNPLFELDGMGKPKLAFNGGPTQTIRLLPGSPALDQGSAAPFNEVQVVVLQASSGTYTLTFNGQTTAPLAFNATAAQVQAALNALPTIGGVGGSVAVTQSLQQFGVTSAVSSAVAFGGSLAGSNQPLLEAATADSFYLEMRPVVDGGTFTAPTTDQRGEARPNDLPSVANVSGGNGSDIGAYEQQCATITLASLPNGTAGTTYSQALNPGGGAEPYTITVTGGSLPPGLMLTGSSLSGTPTATGTFNFTLTAADGFGCASSQSYSLTFVCASVTLLPPALPPGALGVMYNQTVGTLPTGAFTFNLTSGALPPGLTLSAATGAITGVPQIGGTFSFTITATGPGCVGAASYSLTINCQPISFTTVSPLPGGQAGVAYSQTLGVTPASSYTFSLLTGSLPAGLTLNPSTGVLSGVTSQTGTYVFTVQAQNASGCLGTQSYTLVVGCPTITVNPASLPNGATGTAYSQTLSASPAGGNYTYAVSSGALPTGLNLNPSTGVLSGTPTANGSFSFTVTATGWGGCTGSRAYTVVIGGGGCPTISLPGSLANGAVGQLYNSAVAASPAGLYSYAVTGGSLPAGVTLFGANGLIFGYPTAAGSYTFTITATQGACSASQQYTVLIGAGFASSLTVFSDFDGDGKSDLSVFRGSDGNWLVANSSSGQTQSTPWGSSAAPYLDLTVSGDYDGDGKTDLAVFRRGTDLAGYWFIKQSSDGQVRSHFWGLPTDIPVPGDYDADGKTDIAIWRGSSGAWYIVRSSDGGVEGIFWGKAVVGDVPVPGDYDGDGKTDVAVFRKADGFWHLKRSSDGVTVSTKWGVGTDVPVPGDYDGDGKTDLAVWRASDGNWYIIESGSALLRTVTLGAAGDVPVAGDFDGDGKADAAVWNASNGTWRFNRSSDGAEMSKTHGQSGDVPIAARRN